VIRGLHGWFSGAGLLATTEDECESTETEKGGGGGLGDDTSLLELEPRPGIPPGWRNECTANLATNGLDVCEVVVPFTSSCGGAGANAVDGRDGSCGVDSWNVLRVTEEDEAVQPVGIKAGSGIRKVGILLRQ